MINIQPKTYNQIVRLCGCLKLQQQVPSLADEDVERLYYFICGNPSRKVIVTRDTLSMMDETGAEVEAFGITPRQGTVYDRIVLTGAAFNIINTTVSNGDSGCGGCGGNNNNNNNNNNA